MTLLSINAGSSSLKVAVFDETQPEQPVTSLSVEGIGTENSCLIPEGTFGSDDTRRVPIETPEVAAELVKQWLTEEKGLDPSHIHAIGYRIVHGGERFKAATRITNDVTQYLESITPLAPNHMPATLASIRAFEASYPDASHVACFDTSFFHDVPAVAKALPIARDIQEELGIRRFGFHGLSYEYLLNSFKENEGDAAAKGRVIIAHLGSGASVCAIKDGAPVDMSMGFTPVSGIMMSTRSGDIEPGVLTYIQEQKGYSAKEIAELVTHKSGLLGVSGTTADMYTLLHSQENPDVALAVELFCNKIKKQIGSYMAVLGGVDSIIFSGGIGERSAEIRGRALSQLEDLGIFIDDARNQGNERTISTDESRVGVHVIPTREDVSIIKQTLAATQQ